MKTVNKKYTIAVAGIGYVGLSNAVLLSQNHPVYAVDVVQAKADLINSRKSPIKDPEIEEYLARHELCLTATTDAESAYKDADFVIVSTPTNYDPVRNYFDTINLLLLDNLYPLNYTKQKLSFLPLSIAPDIPRNIF